MTSTNSNAKGNGPTTVFISSTTTISDAITTCQSTGPFSQNSLVLAGPIPTSTGANGVPIFVPYGFTASGTTPTATASSTPSPANVPPSSSMSQPVIISVVIAGGVVVAVAISLICWIIRRRRQRLDKGVQLDSPPESPRAGSMPREGSVSQAAYPSQMQPQPRHMSSRSRSIPAPLPIHNSPFLDEKETFVPAANAISPSIYDSSSGLLSPRRPTHPFFSPRQPTIPLLSPLTPVSPIVQTIRRSRSFNDAGSIYQLYPVSPMHPAYRSELPSPLPSSATFVDAQGSPSQPPLLDIDTHSPAPASPAEFAPVELPTDRSSRYPGATPILKRSTTARSEASSKYSRSSRMTKGSGVGYGVGIAPDPMPVGGKSKTTSWNTLSIQSILDLMRSGSTKEREADSRHKSLRVDAI